VICPHRRNRRKAPTQDGRKLRRYRRRWKVERSISWLQDFRRPVTRYEHYATCFTDLYSLLDRCVGTVLKYALVNGIFFLPQLEIDRASTPYCVFSVILEKTPAIAPFFVLLHRCQPNFMFPIVGWWFPPARISKVRYNHTCRPHFF